MTVSADTAQVGSNQATVAAKVAGSAGKIAFNSRYLLDFLNALEGESLTLAMKESLDPGIFRSEKDTSLLHLIMPVRVQEE